MMASTDPADANSALRISVMATRKKAKATTTEMLREESLGPRLAGLRKEAGYTQVELSEVVDTTQSVISDYETDRLRPNPDMVVRLAEALGCSTDEILGRVESRRAQPLARRWAKRMREIDKLPKRDREALIRTIDAFLGNAVR